MELYRKTASKSSSPLDFVFNGDGRIANENNEKKPVTCLQWTDESLHTPRGDNHLPSNETDESWITKHWEETNHLPSLETNDSRITERNWITFCRRHTRRTGFPVKESALRRKPLRFVHTLAFGAQLAEPTERGHWSIPFTPSQSSPPRFFPLSFSFFRCLFWCLTLTIGKCEVYMKVMMIIKW